MRVIAHGTDTVCAEVVVDAWGRSDAQVIVAIEGCAEAELVVLQPDCSGCLVNMQDIGYAVVCVKFEGFIVDHFSIRCPLVVQTAYTPSPDI